MGSVDFNAVARNPRDFGDLLTTILAAPAFILKNLVESGDDIQVAMLEMVGKRELTFNVQ